MKVFPFQVVAVSPEKKSLMFLLGMEVEDWESILALCTLPINSSIFNPNRSYTYLFLYLAFWFSGVLQGKLIPNLSIFLVYTYFSVSSSDPATFVEVSVSSVASPILFIVMIYVFRKIYFHVSIGLRERDDKNISNPKPSPFKKCREKYLKN